MVRQGNSHGDYSNDIELRPHHTVSVTASITGTAPTYLPFRRWRVYCILFLVYEHHL